MKYIRHVNFSYSFGANIDYRTIAGETAISVAHKYGHNNVLARLSNTTCIVDGNSYFQCQFNSYSMKTDHNTNKSLIHYESEKRKKHKDNTWVNIRYSTQLLGIAGLVCSLKILYTKR